MSYLVRYRNYYYDMSSSYNYPYRDFDDVYGWVQYVFYSDHVEIDYASWKTAPTVYGVQFQQMPVAFLTQLNKFTTSKSGVLQSVQRKVSSIGFVAQSGFNNTVNSAVSRWVTAEAVAVSGTNEPVMSPGDALTLAFYNAAANGKCVTTRSFNGAFFGSSSSTTQNYIGISHSSYVQNMVTFQPMVGNIMMSRAILAPGRAWENSPTTGKKISAQVGLLETQGGWMPTWECNR